MPKGFKICLACSGGGHLRQILLLADLYHDCDHFFVTQATPLAESIQKEHRVHFVGDVALGLLKKSPGMWRACFRNLVECFRIYWRERPDVVLSTGAGAVLNLLWIARLSGSKVIFLETFAHAQTPSLTGRLIAPIAQAHLVQWESLQKKYPRATVASPLVETGKHLHLKAPLPDRILVTVGTHGPFDRLIREVERLIDCRVIQCPVTAQVGPGGYRSDRMECLESCHQEKMQELLQEAGTVITHAGTGSILSGLQAGCKVIAIARSAAQGEHYDDHQLEILEEMRSRKAILGGGDPGLLEGFYRQVDAFTPMEVLISPEPILQKLREILAGWFK